MVFSDGASSLFKFNYSGPPLLHLPPWSPRTSVACFDPMANFLVITRRHSSYIHIYASMCNGIGLDNRRTNRWCLYDHGYTGRNWIFCNCLLYQHDLRIIKSYTSLDAFIGSSALSISKHSFGKFSLSYIIMRF